MSGSATSLPPELRELMQQSCIWEASTGTDGYGQSTFADPVTISCRVEPRAISTGGFDADRGATDWVFNPTFELIFNGDDPNVRAFTLNDRFTVPYVGGPMQTQPAEITPWFGPNYDNKNPWLVSVVVSE